MKFVKFLLTLSALALAGTQVYAQDIPPPTQKLSSPKAEVKKDTVAISSIKATDAILKMIKARKSTIESFERITQTMPDSIANYLQATRRWHVVPQSDALDACIKAIESGDSTLSGVGEEIKAAFRSIKYPICIRINDYKDQTISRTMANTTAEVRNIRLGASVQFLDAAKGIIKEGKEITVEREFYECIDNGYTRKGNAETEEVIPLTAKELCRKIAFSIVEFLAPYQVINVGKSKGGAPEITINKGKDTDIKKGQVYDVFEVGEEMFDPETGESLGKSETLIAKAKITSCRAKFSKAKVIWLEEDCEITVGNVVVLEEKDAEENDE